MRQDDGIRAVRLVVARLEGTAGDRLHAEHLEEGGLDAGGAQDLRLSTASEPVTRKRIDRALVEHIVLLFPVEVIRG